MGLNEFELSEKPAIEMFQDIGYEYKKAEEINPGGGEQERDSFSEVVLRRRLEQKLRELNPDIPEDSIQEAISELLAHGSPNLMKNNKNFHENLVEGVSVEYERDGERIGDRVQVVDFDTPKNNDFLVVNQFGVKIGDNPKRTPDLVVFLNGLPIGVFEFKDPTNPRATMEMAYEKVTGKYKRDISDLFNFTEFVVLMDKNNAKIGTLGTSWDWFCPWSYIEEEGDTRPDMAPQEVLIRGAFDKRRMLNLLQHYIVFDEEKGGISKKLAAYHQFYGVEEAVKSTLEVVPEENRNRIGAVWHTQGSGKSLSMVFYAKRVRRLSELKNPTLVVVTDRKSLDEQIHDTFDNAGFNVEWADSIPDLRTLLDREAGGLIFTTIHKFQTEEGEQKFPEINDRQNVIVIADEAHRTQYKKLAENMRIGLPNASFLGFTATPIELEDRSTYATFGEYISEYPINQSEEDESTVPIFYESRMAKLQLNDEKIKREFEELMKSKSDDLKKEMAERWSRLRKIIENQDERLERIAEDIVQHFNNRELEGKGLVVAISRKAAVKYKEKIEQIDEAPETEVVITNPEEFVDDPKDEETLKKRFKDDEDSLKLVVVCEKWTTGFDVPCLHTMYIDRPMKNHNLMQTIGRVNRAYKDKPAGLIVDYIGIGENLKEAMDKYTSDIRERAMQDIDFAIGAMKRQHQKVKSFFEHTDYEGWEEKQGLELQRLVHHAENEVLETKEKEEKFKDAVKQLKKSYSLVSPHKEALKIRSDVVFFEAVKESIEKPISRKSEVVGREKKEKVASAMKELISEGISVEELVEIVGLETRKKKHVLSDDFLQEVQNVEYENVQVKLLEKLIRNEIVDRKKRNLAKYRHFEERLEETIEKYHQNFLTTKEVFDQLIDYANELREEADRTERLGLSEEELAFYDAISDEGSKELEEEKLKDIASELRRRLKEKSKAVDWTNRKKIKSEMKSEVKRILRKRDFSYKEYKPLVEPIVDQAQAFYGEPATGTVT